MEQRYHSESTKNYRDQESEKMEISVTSLENDVTSRKLKMVATIIGYKKSSWMAIFFPLTCSVLIIMMVSAFLAIVKNWMFFNSRFQAIEDFIVLVYAVSLMLEFRLEPENLMIILKTMENEFYNMNAGPFSEEKIKLRREILQHRKSIHDYFILIIALFNTINYVLPVIFGVVQIQSTGLDKIKNHELTVSFECWFPFNIESTPQYLLLSLFQGIGNAGFSICCYLWFCSTTLSLSSIKYDIKFLCIYIKEMDHNINWSLMDSCAAGYPKHSREEEMRLRIYFGHIIKQHQTIKRKVKVLNDALSILLFIFNQACTIQFCVALYGCIEGKEISQKLKYGLLMIVVFWCLALFCWIGQQLMNEGEELYLTFAHCSWIGKPLWFKKSLNIILTCSRKPLRVMPFGLYALNFDNIATVLQAAYSYFNLMHSTNKK